MKMLSKALLPVKTAAHKFDYVFRILSFSATSSLVNLFGGHTIYISLWLKVET